MKEDITPSLTAEMIADSSTSGAEKTAAARAALDRIAEMVQLMRAAEERLAEAEERLKREKASLFRIASEDLPELLRESGFERVTLEDGTTVVVADEISCSIAAERAPEAHAWLREKELGGVIKTLVIASFGKDEVQKADAAYTALLKQLGSDRVEQKESVHPSTLKSLLKELMEKGIAFPLALFGVHPYSIAKLSITTKRKSS